LLLDGQLSGVAYIFEVLDDRQRLLDESPIFKSENWYTIRWISGVAMVISMLLSLERV
jgi:hypothetical protein